METNLNFGQALEALKQGKRVQREGWNDKGMHIFLEEHFEFLIPAGTFKGQKRKYEPVICMFTAQGTIQPGWLASQPDMLSEDWRVVEDEVKKANVHHVSHSMTGDDMNCLEFFNMIKKEWCAK